MQAGAVSARAALPGSSFLVRSDARLVPEYGEVLLRHAALGQRELQPRDCRQEVHLRLLQHNYKSVERRDDYDEGQRGSDTVKR